jgi:hypothetical protein
MNKPILFISVSLGWVIRNFFQTDIVENLKAHFQVIVLATPKTKRSLDEQGFNHDITIIEIEVGEEPLIWKLFRQLKKKIYMEGRQSSTEALWEKYLPRPIYQKIGSKIIKSIITICNAQKFYDIVDRLDLRLNRDTRLSGIFNEYKPVIFFATHATSYFEECLLRNVSNANIPSVLMILSWDHLSSKILLNRGFKSIFVWNELTKDEILRTYPHYRSEQIKVVGIPQYDLYATKPCIAYDNWCRKYGLDSTRRTILFSTMPQSRHEQQHIILEMLLKTIIEGKRLPPDLQVLIKCHPFDDFKGYNELLNRFPVGIHRNSLNTLQSQEDWSPTSFEMEASRDALYFCALNINIFSTLTIEAAYFNKPIVHIAFDPLPIKNRIPCHEYYNLDHFKPIVDTGASILAYSCEEMFEAINKFIITPELLAEQRKMLVKKFVGREVGTASKAVTGELLQLFKELKRNKAPHS